jgi:hypothetical protein
MGFPIEARFAHPDGGYEGDQRQAAEHLTPGEVYTVVRLEVGRSSSRLFLDIPGGPFDGFNTVMFEAPDLPGLDFDDDDEPEADGGDGVSTAGELADYLAAQPRDRKVILRKDAEGNGHSPLAKAWEGFYEPDSTYSGEVYPTAEDVASWVAAGEWTEEDAADLYEPGDKAERVVVLGPVN